MKKLFVMLLVLVLAVSCSILLTQPAEAATDGYYTYTVMGGKATITDCNAAISGVVTIPDTLGGYPVTAIGDYAFENCYKLTDVTVGDGVTQVGKYAFSGCTRLATIIIADSVTYIGESVFSGCCSLSSLQVPFVGDGSGKYTFGYFFDTASVAGATATTQTCDGSSTGVTYYIPNSLTSVTVTGGMLLQGAFENCARLTNLTVGDGVTRIAEGALSGCGGLRSITIPFVGESKMNPNGYPFGYIFGTKSYTNSTYTSGFYIPTKLKTVTVTGGKIPDDAFSMCRNLTTITLGEGVTEIGDYAFYVCQNLKEAVIPGSVTAIGEKIFIGCTNLTSLTVPFVGNRKTVAGDNFRYPLGYFFGTSQYDGGAGVNQTYYEDGKMVTTIFYIPKTLTTVTVLGGEIAPGAFMRCERLTDVNLLGTPTEIGEQAFAHCTKLSVNIPSSVVTIGEKAFYNTSVSNEVVSLPNVKSVSDYAFYACGLSSLIIEDGVETIGTYAFANCTGLSKVVLPDSLTKLGNYAFYGCTGLTEVRISEGMTSIPTFAFGSCSGLASVTIPVSVTDIGWAAFYDCTNLKNVYYEGSKNQWKQITIGNNNEKLTSATLHTVEAVASQLSVVTLPEKTIYKGGEALDTTGLVLKVIYSDGAEKTVTEGYTVSGYDPQKDGAQTVTVTYENVTATFQVTVQLRYRIGLTIKKLPNITEYWLGTQPDTTGMVLELSWSDGSAEEVTTGYAVTVATDVPGQQTATVSYEGLTATFTVLVKKGGVCGENLTWYLDDAGTITISGTGAMTDFASSEAVAWYQFRDEIRKAVILPGVTTLGKYAFSYCGNLEEVSIPEGVTKIGWEAFSRTNSLATVVFPETVETIEGYLFYRSEGLQSVVIPNRVTELGGSVFSRCYNLSQVTIGSGITTLNRYTFFMCLSLETVTIPDNITSLGEQVFEGCSGLVDITISKNVQSIGKRAFADCTALETVTYGNPYADWQKVQIAAENEPLLAALLYTDEGGTELMITMHPESVTVYEGASVRFSVMAKGKGLQYQWQFRNPGAEQWKNSTLESATKPILLVENITGGHHARQYRCVITDATGETVTTDYACLQVAYIAVMPGTQWVKPNTNVQYTARFSLPEATYQWQYKTFRSDSVWTNTGLTGCNTDTLTVGAMPGRNGYSYRCVITYKDEIFYTAAEEARGAILYVEADPAQVTSHPGNRTVTCGVDAKFTVVATGDGVTYQWQYMSPSVGVWCDTKLPGYDKDTLTVKAYDFRSGYRYRCMVMTPNGSGVTKTYSNEAKLTVLPAAEISVQPQSVTAEVATSATFHVEASGDGLTYQWQFSRTRDRWVNTNLEGAQTNTLTVPTLGGRNGYYYRCIIKNRYASDGAGEIITDEARLTVIDSSLKITLHPENRNTVPYRTVSFSADGVADTVGFRWYYSVDGGQTWRETYLNGYNERTLYVDAEPHRNGYLYRCRIKSSTGECLYTESALLSIY